jgi:ankyrin repeat protein
MLLLKHGVAVDIANKQGRTPLHFAALQGMDKICQALVTAGASVAAADAGGVQPIHAAADRGHTMTVAYLIDSGADKHAATAEGIAPLHVAARGGHASTVKLLLALKCDANATTHGGLAPLHIAAQEGLAAAAELLLEDGAAAVDCRTSKGITPLHIAAKEVPPLSMQRKDVAAPRMLQKREGVGWGWVGGCGGSLVTGGRGARRDHWRASGRRAPVSAGGSRGRGGRGAQGFDDVVQLLCRRGADVNAQVRRATQQRDTACAREVERQRARDAGAASAVRR